MPTYMYRPAAIILKGSPLATQGWEALGLKDVQHSMAMVLPISGRMAMHRLIGTYLSVTIICGYCSLLVYHYCQSVWCQAGSASQCMECMVFVRVCGGDFPGKSL